MFVCNTCVKGPSVFSMRSMQLLCVIEYLFCIPEAVLWDCRSFNYSLILKDQRSLPQSTPCISLYLRAHRHMHAYTHTHIHLYVLLCACTFTWTHVGRVSVIIRLCSIFEFWVWFPVIIKRVNAGLFKFSIEEPSVIFLIRLLGEIFLYQPRACTSPQKGVTDHPLAWGREHVLFSWSTFMSWCVWTCVCVCVFTPTCV